MSFLLLGRNTPRLLQKHMESFGFLAASIATHFVLANPREQSGSTTSTVVESDETGPQDLTRLRKEYSDSTLSDEDVRKDPMDMFSIWLNEACQAKVIEPNAMCLSTCADNRPSARYVLLKAYDHRGFVWYTNYESRKAEQIKSNPYGALTFWWGELERSVRIEGEISKISDEESEAYFKIRPRGSQIGAWSSNQSRPIADREELDMQELKYLMQFENDTTIPRPPHWGGYRLKPTRIEFWKGRHGRMHDRILYEDVKSAVGHDQPAWAITRLQP